MPWLAALFGGGGGAGAAGATAGAATASTAATAAPMSAAAGGGAMSAGAAVPYSAALGGGTPAISAGVGGGGAGGAAGVAGGFTPPAVAAPNAGEASQGGGFFSQTDEAAGINPGGDISQGQGIGKGLDELVGTTAGEGSEAPMMSMAEPQLMSYADPATMQSISGNATPPTPSTPPDTWFGEGGKLDRIGQTGHLSAGFEPGSAANRIGSGIETGIDYARSLGAGNEGAQGGPEANMPLQMQPLQPQQGLFPARANDPNDVRRRYAMLLQSLRR